MKTLNIIPERWLVWAIRFLVAVTFLVPLITFSSYYFPYIVPRNVAFRIIVEVVVLLYTVLVLQNRSYIPKWNWALSLLTGFVGAMTLASLINGTFQYSFWSNYERMDGLVTMYHLYAYFFILFATVRQRRSFEQLMQLSIFIAFAVALIGFSQVLGVNLLRKY